MVILSVAVPENSFTALDKELFSSIKISSLESEEAASATLLLNPSERTIPKTQIKYFKNNPPVYARYV